ncbi:MAG: hypothetical protein ACQEQ4_01170 [Fibrobacterota bacterium]
MKKNSGVVFVALAACILGVLGTSVFFSRSLPHESDTKEDACNRRDIAVSIMEREIGLQKNELTESIHNILNSLKRNREFILAYFVENRKTARVVRRSMSRYGELFSRLDFLFMGDHSGIVVSEYGAEKIDHSALFQKPAGQVSVDIAPNEKGLMFSYGKKMKEAHDTLLLAGGRVLRFDELVPLAEQCGVDFVVVETGENAAGETFYSPLYSSLDEEISRFGIKDSNHIIINNTIRVYEKFVADSQFYFYVIDADKDKKETGKIE